MVSDFDCVFFATFASPYRPLRLKALFLKFRTLPVDTPALWENGCDSGCGGFELPRKRAIMSDAELEIDWQMPFCHRLATNPHAERFE